MRIADLPKRIFSTPHSALDTYNGLQMYASYVGAILVIAHPCSGFAHLCLRH
jgi:hypothetical protein